MPKEGKTRLDYTRLEKNVDERDKTRQDKTGQSRGGLGRRRQDNDNTQHITAQSDPKKHNTTSDRK